MDGAIRERDAAHFAAGDGIAFRAGRDHHAGFTRRYPRSNHRCKDIRHAVQRCENNRRSLRRQRSDYGIKRSRARLHLGQSGRMLSPGRTHLQQLAAHGYPCGVNSPIGARQAAVVLRRHGGASAILSPQQPQPAQRPSRRQQQRHRGKTHNPTHRLLTVASKRATAPAQLRGPFSYAEDAPDNQKARHAYSLS